MRRFPAVVLLSLPLLASCGNADNSAAPCRPVTALVASSLVDAFGKSSGNQCADAWTVTGGSSNALAAQVLEGSPADVLVAAGTKTVAQLQNAGATVGEPVMLGSVRATLLMSISHNEAVTLRDMPQRVSLGWKIGACVVSAPCGAMADTLLANATAAWGKGFTRTALVATEASSAGDLVMKVSTGELDAALIYENVCETAPDTQVTVRCVDIPDEADGHALNVKTPYVAVRLKAGENADSFMDYVRSAGFREYLSVRMRIR